MALRMHLEIHHHTALLIPTGWNLSHHSQAESTDLVMMKANIITIYEGFQECYPSSSSLGAFEVIAFLSPFSQQGA
jgi:hypothetical protein